jgi:hypothetical protein
MDRFELYGILTAELAENAETKSFLLFSALCDLERSHAERDASSGGETVSK